MHIRHRIARTVALAVGKREGRAPAIEQADAAGLTNAVDQRVSQFIDPAPRRCGELVLHILVVDLGHLPRGGSHGEVDARKAAVAELHIEVGLGSRKRRHQDALELDAQIGRISLAQDIHQARDEAVERVAPDKQAQPLAFSQGQDAQGGVVQGVVGHLEQVIARVSFENVMQRLGQMAARRQAGAVSDGLGLAAQQRDVGHAGAVGRRCEKADETVLADDLARGVVAFHTDVVGIAGPVHGGSGVGLGHHHQRRRGPCERSRLGRQRLETVRQARRIVFTQQPQAGAGHGSQRVLPVVDDQIVLAVAQQGQVVVGQPLHERTGFVALLRRHRRGQVFEFMNDLVQPPDHRLPVGDRDAHVGKHTLDAGHQIGALLRLDQPVDLCMNPGFERRSRCLWRLWHGCGQKFSRLDRQQLAPLIALHRNDRVHDQVQGQALAVDLHRDGVDQKGHVVIDDVDHRMARLPAGCGNRGAEHPNLGLALAACCTELPVRKHGAQQILGAARAQILGIDLSEVLAAENVDQVFVRQRNSLEGQFQHRFDPLTAHPIH